MRGRTSKQHTLGPRDVLGVPLLPPGAITVATNRVRAAVGRGHRAMAPPPLQILESMFGLLDHRVLTMLCAAGVPDALQRSMSVDELATTLGLDGPTLRRVCRFAHLKGWLRIDRKGRVRPTRVTAFLRTDHPGGWAAWVEFAGAPEVVAALQAFTADASVVDAFAEANGAPFFEWMREHPTRWAAFDAAMAAGARMHALALAAAVDWKSAASVCDVGGGTGALLRTLLDITPHLRGELLDLPDVVARAAQHERLTITAGDAFREVPTGHDTYLLVNVLHDWGDDEAVRILTTVARAMPPTGRVIVVDNDPSPTAGSQIATATDVLMAALTPGGRERTTAEFSQLAARAGLRHERTLRLASADLAHTLRRRSGTTPS